MIDKDKYLLIWKELTDIPKQLWDIFICKTDEDLKNYEANLLQHELTRRERREAYSYWKAHNLPLKYRRYPMRLLKIMLRIKLLKRSKKDDKYKDPDNLFGDNYGKD